VQGLYTAVTWITTVVACCRALARRSFMPLLVVPPMAVALALIRPWTVDDFVALWITHAMRGDVTALVSVIAIPVVGWTMVRSERGAQRVQNHLRLSRMDVDE
jgi:hypothetical protein